MANYNSTHAISGILLAYWDYGRCGPHGNDNNWEWCDKNEGGPCQHEVRTNNCRSGWAKLQEVHGNQYATSYSHQYEVDGCKYTYYAKYICAGMLYTPILEHYT